MFRRFDAEELASFLRALDRHLVHEARVVVIGGSAIALRFDSKHATADLDLISAGQDVLAAAMSARRDTGLQIPLGSVGIFSAPYSYEERCEPLAISGLKLLKVFTPERHDLAVMKIARGATHDLEAIEDIHRKDPLDEEVLIQRFTETHVIGSSEMFRLSLLAAIARLWGEAKAADFELRLPR